jgi:hypothetical protein
MKTNASLADVINITNLMVLMNQADDGTTKRASTSTDQGGGKRLTTSPYGRPPKAPLKTINLPL